MAAKSIEGASRALGEKCLLITNNPTQPLLGKTNVDASVDLEDLVLRELRKTKTPISLKELQMKMPSMRPVATITVAATLDRLCRKGKAFRKLVREGRPYYVYSQDSREIPAFAARETPI
jgi:hypothetical protein